MLANLNLLTLWAISGYSYLIINKYIVSATVWTDQCVCLCVYLPRCRLHSILHSTRVRRTQQWCVGLQWPPSYTLHTSVHTKLWSVIKVQHTIPVHTHGYMVSGLMYQPSKTMQVVLMWQAYTYTYILLFKYTSTHFYFPARFYRIALKQSLFIIFYTT